MTIDKGIRSLLYQREFSRSLSITMPAKSESYYAVKIGYSPGIYRTWEECQNQTSGFSNATFKKFRSRDDAIDFMKMPIEPNDTPAGIYLRLNNSSGTLKPEPVVGRSGYVVSNLNQEDRSSSSKGIQRIYTDGASRGNGKVGAKAGYGVYYGEGDPRNKCAPLKGPVQTNQRAELSAVNSAMETIYFELKSRQVPVPKYLIYTDSQYSINCITKWAPRWSRNNWLCGSGERVSNRDLIEPGYNMYNDINRAYQERGLGPLQFIHVRGHSGEPGNELADSLANRGVEMHNEQGGV